MSEGLKRRDFVKKVALGGASLFVLKDARAVWSYQANNKLNIAFVGAGGRGAALIDEFAKLGENIVALCDVDWNMAAGSFKKFPNAKRYFDFRKMLDDMHNQIDAVVVATADHTHAVASVAAMKLGKHVYCEKPLTYCVWEARVMREVAKQQKVATQMGNQGMGSSGTRQLIEIIRSGAIGHVREVHLWTDRPIWPQGIDRPKDTPPVPQNLDWDLWLGPAPYRPYPSRLPIPSVGEVGLISAQALWATSVAMPSLCLSWLWNWAIQLGCKQFLQGTTTKLTRAGQSSSMSSLLAATCHQ